MITNVSLVYNDDYSLRRIGGPYTIKGSPIFQFIDERTLKGKKETFSLKGHWGARETPFAICYDGDKPVKAFYSETGEDVVDSLIKYLNENTSTG